MQSADGDCDTIEQTVEGAFYEKDGSFYLLYREPAPDTGKDGDSILLKATGNEVVLRRTGSVSSVMQFESGKTDTVLYRMPYGTMEMELDCRSVAIDFAETGGRVALDYILQIGHARYENNMVIKVEAGGDYI